MSAARHAGPRPYTAVDRSREAWPRTAGGEILMRTDPLDLPELLHEAGV
jgi:catechol-2,3-dioxygenase